MGRIYGKEVKRSIKFDDTNQDFMMDIKLPTSQNWHNITIGQAREAKRIREQLDMQNIRRTALSNAPNASGTDKDKARALMLSLSPNRPGDPQPTASGPSGVVHINNIEDWRRLESARGDGSTRNEGTNNDTLDNSIEEILRGGSSR